MIEMAIAGRTTADLAPAFEARSMCWSRYQTFKQATESDPYFSSANPILSTIDHPSGRRYPAAGAAGTIPSETRQAPRAAARLGEHTDEVLSEVLGLSHAEITRLYEEGLAADP
jgi:2-methylfumaryl-CoA isomerase